MTPAWEYAVPKINVYLPEELATSVRAASLPVSAICQAALEQALRGVQALRSVDEPSWSATDPEAERGPFSRFTPRARHAIALAQVVARNTPHNYVGTEHLLRGILDEDGNLALEVLTTLDIEIDDLRAELDASMGPATEPGPERLPFTPLLKSSLQLAVREALGLGHNYVGCEHLLLGLLATEDGLASKVLGRMGVDLRPTKRAVVAALAGFVQTRETRGVTGDTNAQLAEILRRLDALEQRIAS